MSQGLLRDFLDRYIRPCPLVVEHKVVIMTVTIIMTVVPN